MKPKTESKTSTRLRKHFLSGLAVGSPVVLTLWLVWSIVMMIDGWVLPLIPKNTISADGILRQVPGIGVLIFLVLTVALGIIAKGFFGRTLVRLGDAIINRVPVVSSIYTSIKQIVETILGQDGPKFQKACLIEYPRKDVWSIAFVSTDAKGEIVNHVAPGGERVLSVFLPTTPNPMSGFLLFVKEQDAQMLDMGIDDAVKLIISAGLVYPQDLESAAR
ncbi:DUF502 domain-containing protein [Loktanella sp. DJP18]|uniref:DUF502 domain-containing protein n=1 Tax=Loktanella sp. DJP18 TaxID=3409788 RepID=UPI003BB5B044